MDIINREADKQSIGFRYQKQRALLHILNSMKESKEFFFAIEYLDDVYGQIHNEQSVIEIVEQDKYYDVSTSFTFSKKEIYVSIINFLENWLANKRSSVATYLFVSTNKIGKEQNTKVTKTLEINLPEMPILQLLKDRTYREQNDLLDTITTLIIYRYKEQYSHYEKKGYLSEIENLQNNDWILFLDRIEYLFEQGDTETVKNQALEEIRNSAQFDKNRHKNKEDYVYSRIIDLLDERQSKDYPANFITYSDIKNIFLELAEQEQTKQEDPLGKLWEEEEIDDTRGIEEKILAVNNNFSLRKLKLINRRVSQAYIEETKASDQNKFLAQKYRIFLKCSELLIEQFEVDDVSELTEQKIVDILQELYTSSVKILESLANTYNYPYNNEETIKGIVLNLFNECYLAFDEV